MARVDEAIDDLRRALDDDPARDEARERIAELRRLERRIAELNAQIYGADRP